MSDTFTITEMAEHLAGPAASDEQKALLHRQIRIFHKKGFLPVKAVKDARGTAEFDPLCLYRVRVLSALVAIGLDSDAGLFREVVRAMAANDVCSTFVPPSTIVDEDGTRLLLGGLGDAVRGVAAGEAWLLSISHQTPYLHGMRDYTAVFHHADDKSATEPTIVEGTAYKTVFRGTIYLNDLFAGLQSADADA